MGEKWKSSKRATKSSLHYFGITFWDQPPLALNSWTLLSELILKYFFLDMYKKLPCCSKTESQRKVWLIHLNKNTNANINLYSQIFKHLYTHIPMYMCLYMSIHIYSLYSCLQELKNQLKLGHFICCFQFYRYGEKTLNVKEYPLIYALSFKLLSCADPSRDSFG